MKEIYYLIGQPGSGKTTIGKLLCNHIDEMVYQIDGDDLRLLFQNNDYSTNGRIKNINRAHDIATFLSNNDTCVVLSMVSPFKELRENFKLNNNVIEIYLHTTEDRGKCQYYVNDYEPPVENFIDIDTTNLDEMASFKILLSKI